MIQKIKLVPSYSKPSGIKVFDRNDIVELIPFRVKESYIIELTPGSFGGNHIHPRREAFFAIGDLVFQWMDKEGKVQEEKFNDNGEKFIIVVDPFVSHAVINKSNSVATLIEYADQKQKNVEEVVVYKG